MSPRRRPYYHDAEALKLIVEHLADWILVEDDHLTAEQQMEKWEAKEEADQAAALATARDGNWRPYLRGWLKERRWDPSESEEAEQLIAERLTGGAKRSHRSGPAHGTYSRNHEVAKRVPVIKEILHVFYPVVPERDLAKWAFAMAAEYYGLRGRSLESFKDFWNHKRRPPSAIAGADLERFRQYLVHQRTLYLAPENIELSRQLFPRTFAE